MTVKANISIIPAKRQVSFTSEIGSVGMDAYVAEGGRVCIYDHGYGGKPRIEIWGADEIDALLELLHAVKADRAAQEPEREADSIIAVEEPTA